MEIDSSLLKKLQLSNQTVLDSLTHPLVVINITGAIIMKNRSWDFFCKENGGTIEKCGIGLNYLSVCSKEVREGIRRVLNGQLEQFTFEYPCHTKKVNGGF